MSCFHDNELIIDSHSGDQICYLCGLVVNTGLSYEEINYTPFYRDEEKTSTVLFNIAAELVSKLHLSQEIVYPVLSRYSKCIKKKQSIKFYSKQEVISYCLYQVLKELNIPRTLKQIQSVSGTSSKALWKLEDLFTKHKTQLKPMAIILSHYTLIDKLKFEDIEVLKNMCNDLGFLNYHPSTVASFVIYKYLIINKRKMSMSKICDLLGVNTKSVARLGNYVRGNIHEFVSEKYIKNT